MAYGGVEVQIYFFSTSTLIGSGQLHVPTALPSGKESQYHQLGGCVGTRAGLDDMKK
jgi:hypothetical protein